MQIKGKYSWLKHLDFMIVDLLALFFSFLLSYWFKFNSFRFFESAEWLRLLLLVLMLNTVITLFVNPYSGIFRRSYYMEFARALQLMAYNLLFASLVFYFFKVGADYSREVLFVMYGNYFLLSSLLKYFWKKLIVTRKVVIYSTKAIPVFIIGLKNNAARTINNVLAGDFKLYDIKGIYLIDDNGTDGIEGVPVIGKDYIQHILSENIGDVLIAAPPSLVSEDVYAQLVANGIGVNFDVESMVGFQAEDQYISNIGIVKTMSIGAYSFTPGQMIYLGIKRLLDILCGLLGLVLLIPITFFVKFVTLASGDRAKLFYNQKRVGKNGKTIKIYKFRSMVPNADEELNEMLKDEKYRKEWEDNQKFENDPRITKVGRFLRKTSIDELPQLINVLRGDMSLVGPRPLIEGELEAHGGLKLYQKVKPGITGWWACNGRSNLDYAERLELEYYYIKHFSLYLDILCIFRTALAVMKKDGAQ